MVDDPLISVVRGRPTPAECAALAVALVAARVPHEPTPSPPPPYSRWARHDRLGHRWPNLGPARTATWGTSALPRQ